MKTPRRTETKPRKPRRPAGGGGGDGNGDIAYGRSVVDAEIRALQAMTPLLDARFAEAVALLLACKGRVVVTGVGKSGLVGQKASATLASTGTPSLFLHAAEAVHGDLGRVLAGDLVLALSYSGSTEVVKLVPVIKKIGSKLVSVTRGHDTPLAKVADVSLAVGNVEEACPIGLAPTSSTTAMLALCDALAMTVAHRKHFDRESFALFHPGGSLGRKLVKVGEVMSPIRSVATVPPGTKVGDALRRMNLPGGKRSSGAVLIVARDGTLAGLFTQGDFARRALEDRGVTDRAIDDVMTRTPRVVSPDDLLADAYRLLERHRFDEVPVVDAAGRAVGMLDVNDVLEWGVAF
ncbi:MAG: Arabinose 5-phosphate isomerase KdsD [Planctomycetes bacterium]|nr:Arabinose 5-phosphate isomerase KdsD [Planctomycetota bacterium]